MIIWKASAEILAIVDKLIQDDKEYRKNWEKTALEVELSYKWIKFPQWNYKQGIHRNNPDEPVVVNIVKRQHRSIQNYFLNNEPAISVRKTIEMKYEDLEASRMLLRRDFIESDFYEEEMDNITDYWMKRWLVYVLSYLTSENKCEVKVWDPFDTYVDTRAYRKSKIRWIVFTFTKSLEEMKEEYPNDMDNVPINWDNEKQEMEKSLSEEKQKLNNAIREPKEKDTFLIREGWWIWYKNGKLILAKTLSTKLKVLSYKEYGEINFLPVTWFAPINDPDNLYPDSWYKWVLTPEKIVNQILNKFVTIVKTGWRYVYVREGTRLTKAKNNLLESLWIDVIEIGKAQELPKEVNLLNISQSQMTLLEKMLRQAEEEGGMRQDIMGSSSMWSDASGRAIEALQAGSKGNVGMAMIELNKFMNRLAKIFFKLYKTAGAAKIKVYNEELNIDMEIDASKLGIPKLHIEPRSAFDDITRKADGIEMLKWIKQFAPETKISPDVIVEIFSLTNDLAKKIAYDMKADEDPDIKMAEASIPLLMQWRLVAVSPDDNHQVHMMMLGKVLSQAGDKLPENVQKNMLDKYKTHEAFAWSLQDPNKKA